MTAWRRARHRAVIRAWLCALGIVAFFALAGLLLDVTVGLPSP